MSRIIFFFVSTLPCIALGESSSSLFGGMCPEQCVCDLDSRGRMEVSCTAGRMLDIPTSKIFPATEIINIVGPKHAPNHLTIGRFFRQFRRLEELHIVGSNIPSIGENSFWGVQSLRTLNLTRNNISLIVESNFKGLVNVEYLSLSENSIESFVSACFQYLSKLKSLDVSKNRISKLVERLFYNLHMLEVLNLSDNMLRELHPDVFRDIWRLKDLRCRRCGLKSINPLLYALLPDLKILDLGDNEFKYLNREEFSHLNHLETLYLDGNQISAITDDTFRSSRFKYLTLSSNRIVRIDRQAFSNASIHSLALSGNKFESLDRVVFQDIKHNLTSLDLSRNPKLKEIQLRIILSENPQLTDLSLANNDYSHLTEDIFENQSDLQALNLSGNLFAEISPPILKPLRSLRTIDLSYNLMKGMDAGVFAILDRLVDFRELIVVGNPWACDLCNIPHLVAWVKKNTLLQSSCRLDPYGKSCLRCASPSRLYDKALISMDESQLDWCNNAEPVSILADDPRLGLFIGCGIIIIILIVTSIIIVSHSRWHAAHYYTHEEDRPEIGTPPVPPDYDQLQNPVGCDNLFYSSGSTNSSRNNKMIATIDEIAYDNSYPELSNYYNTSSNGYNENIASFHR